MGTPQRALSSEVMTDADPTTPSTPLYSLTSGVPPSVDANPTRVNFTPGRPGVAPPLGQPANQQPAGRGTASQPLVGTGTASQFPAGRGNNGGQRRSPMSDRVEPSAVAPSRTINTQSGTGNLQRPRYLDTVTRRTADSGYGDAVSQRSLQPHVNQTRRESPERVQSLEQQVSAVQNQISRMVGCSDKDDAYSSLSSLSSSESFSSLSEYSWENELQRYSEDMPPHVKIGYYDVMILYTEDDRSLAMRFLTHLRHDIKLKEGMKIKAVLYDCEEMTSLSGSKFKHLEAALERCTYVFVYLTKRFVDDKWMEFSSEECLMKAIYDPEKRWCVVPVYTERRGDSFSIPMGLNSLKGINYYNNDEFYRNGVSRLVGDKIYVRKRLEEKHLRKQKRWVEEFKRKQQEEFEQTKRMALAEEMKTEDNKKKLLKQTRDMIETGSLLENVRNAMEEHYGIRLQQNFGASLPSPGHDNSLKGMTPQDPAVAEYFRQLQAQNLSSTKGAEGTTIPPEMLQRLANMQLSSNSQNFTGAPQQHQLSRIPESESSVDPAHGQLGNMPHSTYNSSMSADMGEPSEIAKKENDIQLLIQQNPQIIQDLALKNQGVAQNLISQNPWLVSYLKRDQQLTYSSSTGQNTSTGVTQNQHREKLLEYQQMQQDFERRQQVGLQRSEVPPLNSGPVQGRFQQSQPSPYNTQYPNVTRHFLAGNQQVKQTHKQLIQSDPGLLQQTNPIVPSAKGYPQGMPIQQGNPTYDFFSTQRDRLPEFDEILSRNSMGPVSVNPSFQPPSSAYQTLPQTSGCSAIPNFSEMDSINSASHVDVDGENLMKVPPGGSNMMHSNPGRQSGSLPEKSERTKTVVKEIHHHHHHKKIINIMKPDVVQIGDDNRIQNQPSVETVSSEEEEEEEEDDEDNVDDIEIRKGKEVDTDMKKSVGGEDSPKGSEKKEPVQKSVSKSVDIQKSVSIESGPGELDGGSPSSSTTSVGMDAGLLTIEEQRRGAFNGSPDIIAQKTKPQLPMLQEEEKESVLTSSQTLVKPVVSVSRNISNDPQLTKENVNFPTSEPVGLMPASSAATSKVSLPRASGDSKKESGGIPVAPVKPVAVPIVSVRPTAMVGPQRRSPPSESEETDLKTVQQGEQTGLKTVVDSEQTSVKSVNQSISTIQSCDRTVDDDQTEVKYVPRGADCLSPVTERKQATVNQPPANGDNPVKVSNTTNVTALELLNQEQTSVKHNRTNKPFLGPFQQPGIQQPNLSGQFGNRVLNPFQIRQVVPVRSGDDLLASDENIQPPEEPYGSEPVPFGQDPLSLSISDDELVPEESYGFQPQREPSSATTDGYVLVGINVPPTGSISGVDQGQGQGQGQGRNGKDSKCKVQ